MFYPIVYEVFYFVDAFIEFLACFYFAFKIFVIVIEFGVWVAEDRDWETP